MFCALPHINRRTSLHGRFSAWGLQFFQMPVSLISSFSSNFRFACRLAFSQKEKLACHSFRIMNKGLLSLFSLKGSPGTREHKARCLSPFFYSLAWEQTFKSPLSALVLLETDTEKQTQGNLDGQRERDPLGMIFIHGHRWVEEIRRLGYYVKPFGELTTPHLKGRGVHSFLSRIWESLGVTGAEGEGDFILWCS